MDDAASLIRTLEEKLGELDTRIAAYRADMSAEFHRLSHELLKRVPEEVSREVEQTIADSMRRYHHLGPDFATEASISASKIRPNKGSPPPSVAADESAAGTPDLSHDHDRDCDELQDLLPSFLPLLGSPRGSRPQSPVSPKILGVGAFSNISMSTGSTSNSTSTSNGNTKSKSDSNSDSTSTGSASDMVARDDVQVPGAASPVASPHIQLPVRPSHIRRATDETTSSILSDRSDTSKGRRSALRRSSSVSNKPQSPRRVRFDVEGGEVLPTSSPQTTEAANNILTGPRSPSSLAMMEEFPSAKSLLGDMDDTPPPKKVSSSQALRALSRTPLDVTTVWTVVNAQSEDDPLTPARGTTLPPSVSMDSVRSVETIRGGNSSSTDTLRRDASTGSIPEPGNPIPDSYQSDDSSSEGEFLSMPKSKTKAVSPPAKSPAASSPAIPNPTAASASASASSSSSAPKLPATRKLNKPRFSVAPSDDEDDDDDMFEFEADHQDRLKRNPTVRPPPIEDDEDEDEEIVEGDGETESATVISSTPVAPRPIAASLPKTVDAAATAPSQTRAAKAPQKQQQQQQQQQTHSHVGSIGTVGSYMGRPIVMPIVLDSEIYRQAQAMGNLKSFVGSVDGRTGVDDAYMDDFATTLEQGSFSGAPRSLKERMMMDDHEEFKKQMEAFRKSNKKGSGPG